MNGSFVFDEVFHFACLDRVAFLDNDVIFGQLAGDQEVLFDQHHGGFGCKLSDGFHKLFNQHRGETLAGLVDQQQVIICHQRPDDAEASRQLFEK